MAARSISGRIGELPDPYAGGVIDSVCDRGGYADCAQFADAFGPEGAGDLVYFVIDEGGVEFGDVGVNGYPIAGEVLGDEAAEVGIDSGALEERLPESPDHAAGLSGCGRSWG